MTKAAAMQAFWESFGIPAYEENSVPKNATFPRITYELVLDSFGAPVAFHASVWYRSSSNVPVNAKTEEISRAISRGGVTRPCDGGAVWMQKGRPWAQNVADPDDPLIKRKLLNLTAEFLTAD